MFLLKSGVAAIVHFRIYQFKPHFLSRFSYACAAAMAHRNHLIFWGVMITLWIKSSLTLLVKL